MTELHILAFLISAAVAYRITVRGWSWFADLRKDVNRLIDAEIFPKCPKHNYEKIDSIGTTGDITLIFKCTECGRIHKEVADVGSCNHIWSEFKIVYGAEDSPAPLQKSRQCTKCGKPDYHSRDCLHQWKTELISGTQEGKHVTRTVCTICGKSSETTYGCTHSSTEIVSKGVESFYTICTLCGEIVDRN